MHSRSVSDSSHSLLTTFGLWYAMYFVVKTTDSLDAEASSLSPFLAECYSDSVRDPLASLLDVGKSTLKSVRE